MKISFTLILMFILGNLVAQESWSLEKDKNSIKIYTRKMKDSKLKEYKGSVVLNTTVDKIISLLKNPKNHDKLLYKCKEGSVSVVKKVSENDFYTYMVIGLTWPIPNRDVVTHYTFTNPDANGAVTVYIEAVADLVAKKEGIVRVPKMKGYWKFTPLANGKVEVIHQAFSSPGGNVPEGLANSSAIDAPFYMLSKTQELTK